MFDLKFHNDVIKAINHIITKRHQINKKVEHERKLAYIQGYDDKLKDIYLYDYLNEWSKYFEIREITFKKIGKK